MDRLSSVQSIALQHIEAAVSERSAVALDSIAGIFEREAYTIEHYFDAIEVMRTQARIMLHFIPTGLGMGLSMWLKVSCGRARTGINSRQASPARALQPVLAANATNGNVLCSGAITTLQESWRPNGLNMGLSNWFGSRTGRPLGLDRVILCSRASWDVRH
jgi:hypothetical protein